MSINPVSSSGMGSNIMDRPNTSGNIPQAGKVKNLEKTLEKRNVPSEGREVKKGKEKYFSEEEAVELIGKANKAFLTFDRRFEFSVHEKTKQVMVKVIDVNNDEVIRELPSEKILDMVAAMWEVAGIMIDTKA